MPLPLTVSCFSKIQIGFTFLVPAHPGSLGKGPLNVCVCVCAVAFYPRDAVLLRVLAMALCLSVTSRSSIKKTDERIELVSGIGTFFHPSYTAFKKNSGIS